MSQAGKSKPSLLFIGSLDVAPTFGGPIQFHRHFIERDDFVFQKLIEPSRVKLAHLLTGYQTLDKVTDRLSRTRLFPHFVALNEWIAVRKAIPELMRAVSARRPDAIVTVGYGAYGFAAGEVARRQKIPLVTFFHDWWPDLALQSKFGVRFFDRRMKRLYQQSDLALCVCEMMRRELGQHQNAQILYPIPGNQVPIAPVKPPNQKPLRVAYLGGMTRGYGRMISSLNKAYTALETKSWELAVFGELRDWSPVDVSAIKSSGVYRGERYGEAALQELAAADIFLVAMDFEAITKRRVRTSFPSKLLDYCTFGKPIIVWAPEYSSVAIFAKETQFGLVHTEADTENLIKKIDGLTASPNEMQMLSQSAVRLSQTVFNPNKVHLDLVSFVNGLLRKQKSDGRPDGFR